MFHVKRFDTIGAGNCSSPHTPDGFERSGITREIGLFCSLMVGPCALKGQFSNGTEGSIIVLSDFSGGMRFGQRFSEDPQ
jgi:hypothetical protein